MPYIRIKRPFSDVKYGQIIFQCRCEAVAIPQRTSLSLIPNESVPLGENLTLLHTEAHESIYQIKNILWGLQFAFSYLICSSLFIPFSGLHLGVLGLS